MGPRRLNNYFGYILLLFKLSSLWIYASLNSEKHLSSLKFLVLDIFKLKFHLNMRREKVIIPFAIWFLNGIYKEIIVNIQILVFSVRLFQFYFLLLFFSFFFARVCTCMWKVCCIKDGNDIRKNQVARVGFIYGKVMSYENNAWHSSESIFRCNTVPSDLWCWTSWQEVAICQRIKINCWVYLWRPHV